MSDEPDTKMLRRRHTFTKKVLKVSSDVIVLLAAIFAAVLLLEERWS